MRAREKEMELTVFGIRLVDVVNLENVGHDGTAKAELE